MARFGFQNLLSKKLTDYNLNITTIRSISISLVLLLISACNNSSENIALGTLERDRIAHTATTNEVVTAIPIKKGSYVEKGTVLVKLDDTQQKAIVAKNQALVDQAKANLSKLRNGVREEEIAAARANVAGAKAKLIESEGSFKRTKNLFKNNLASQADLDSALANRDSNLANLHTTKEQLRELIKGTREEDLQIASAHLKATIASLAVEEKKLDDLTIKATRAGILNSLPWNLGERVTVGSPVAVVLAGKAPFARVYVPEPYRVKVKVGDKLSIQVDGVLQTFTGELRWISTEPAFTPYYALNQQERARLMYLAEIQLPDSAIDLPNGIPVQVQLP